MDQTKVLLVKSHSKKKLLFAGVFLWVGLVIGGCLFMMAYADNAGAKSTQVPKTWPESSHLAKSSERASLYVFLHPKCSCSQATLAELERLMPHLIHKVDVVLVFVRLPNQSEDWIKGSLLKRAREITGVRWMVDHDGLESRIFGVKTSGHAFLYDAAGKLAFEGGITPARGHEGDSAGRRAILAWLKKQPSELSSKIFGCSLGFKAAANGN